MNSLAGRSVVITRAAEQADATVELVRSFDAVPILLPLIDIVDEPAGMTELSGVDFDQMDWIVVTSPNGGQRVAAILEMSAASPRLAAVGSTTATTLPRCDLVADTQSALGLLQVFPRGPGQVLVVQAFDAEPTMVDGLRELGWSVTAIRPYRTVYVTPTSEQKDAALAADSVLFASGSAVSAWAAVFGVRTPPVVVAIGDQTAAAAERNGLKISAISADHSMYGMLVTLSRYFSESN